MSELQCYNAYEYENNVFLKNKRQGTVMSFTMCPKCDKEWELFSRAVMSIYESSSNITWSKPVPRALLVAIASTSITMKGSMVFCKRETMTCPISFRITTPIPALFSYANRAPSKFTLYVSLSEGCQQVGGRPTSIMVEELGRLNSRNLSFAWDNSWPRGNVDFPSWRLFLWLHITPKKKKKERGCEFQLAQLVMSLMVK